MLRSRGYFWIASRPEQAFSWSQAGAACRFEPAGRWWAATPRSKWPRGRVERAEVEGDWDERFGDRRQELVLIGAGYDRAKLERMLAGALVTDAELAAGEEAWRRLPDPVPAMEEEILHDDEDHGVKEYRAGAIPLHFTNAECGGRAGAQRAWRESVPAPRLKRGSVSCSLRVRRDVLKRHMTQKDILETVAGAEKHRLHSSGFLMIGLPTETHAERWETVDILAQSRIGRFRTSWFFPFPGTDSYRMTIEGGYLKHDPATDFTTFTDGSALDFGAEENLFIDKLGTVMPWFVNSRMERFHESPASKRYHALVADVLRMTRDEWEAFKPRVKDVDRELASACTKANELHYAIRYNKFMGVRSDYYLAEESGIEWYTAAAKPAVAPGELREAALAAAAAEVC